MKGDMSTGQRSMQMLQCDFVYLTQCRNVGDWMMSTGSVSFPYVMYQVGYILQDTVSFLLYYLVLAFIYSVGTYSQVSMLFGACPMKNTCILH